MDAREIPRILLKEFGKNLVQKYKRDIEAGRGEFWEASLGDGIGATVFDYLPTQAKYLNIWLQKECGKDRDGELHRPTFVAVVVVGEFLYHREGLGNVYRDKVMAEFPLRSRNLKDDGFFVSLACKIIIRAQELVASNAFEFPTYYLPEEGPNPVRIPIDFSFSWSR